MQSELKSDRQKYIEGGDLPLAVLNRTMQATTVLIICNRFDVSVPRRLAEDSIPAIQCV